VRTPLDAQPETLNPDEQRFVEAIREHGWHRMNVFSADDGPGFSYTTGFWLKHGFPEIIVFSLHSEVAGDILWDISRSLRADHAPDVGVRSDALFGNAPGVLLPVGQQHYAEYLGWSRWFYGGNDFPCLQLIWPDEANLFPWEVGADPSFTSFQPDLSPEGWRKALARP
jgi:hypothetical protein